MCYYCHLPLYIKVQQLMRPVLAPLTPEDELLDEYANRTGMKFVQLEKRFCPVCGRKMEVHDENA